MQGASFELLMTGDPCVKGFLETRSGFLESGEFLVH